MRPRRSLCLSVAFFHAAGLLAAVPSTINYQGRLTDTSGNPITATLPMQFRVWDALAGGGLLWFETWDVPNPQVVMTNGIFSVQLGTNAPIPPALFSTGVDRYLEIVVNGETLTPRQKLSSVGWANFCQNTANAEKLGNIDAAGWQQRVSGTCPPGSSIATINSDGSVVCQSFPSTTVAGDQYGIAFRYINPSTIQLQPSGLAGRARVLVSDGTDLIGVDISSALTADLSTAGAGGLDAGVEQPSTGYDVLLIAQAGGVGSALLYTLTGDVPTLPAGYDHQSEVLWFVRNDASSNILPFDDLGEGRCRYAGGGITGGVTVLSNGTVTAPTPPALVNLAGAVPASGEVALLRPLGNRGQCSLNPIDLILWGDSGATRFLGSLEKVDACYVFARGSPVTVPLRGNPSNALYYQWTQGSCCPAYATLVVIGWEMPRAMD